MPSYDSEYSSPGYVETVASSKKKTKEHINFKQLVPSHILENSSKLEALMKSYYTFMNMEEFIYSQTKTFTDVVLDGKAAFRISDPNNENDEFFTDETGAESTLIITDTDGTTTTISLNAINVAITNGNELPGTLANEVSEIGKTYTVTGLTTHNSKTATLTTVVKNWVGPGPSNVMNTIEEAMDIDGNASNYLEFMQKEIAAAIPRDVTVNKRNLYKNIIDFYKVRGSSDSIEIFFRLLFNEVVEVERPYDKTLIPSSGVWDQGSGAFLSNKGFLSDGIKIQDSLRYQKFSYLIKTGKNISDWSDAFTRLVHPAGFKFFGEILLLLNFVNVGTVNNKKMLSTLARLFSAMPGIQPGVIGVEDIPLLVEMFASAFTPQVTADIHKSATLSTSLKNGVISASSITEPGSGYIADPAITFSDGSSGQTNPAGASVTADGFGSINAINLGDGGRDFQSPTVTIAAPEEHIFDGSSSSIVSTSANTITLTAPQAAVFQVNDQLTYTTDGTAIPGLDPTPGSNTYFVKTKVGNAITLSAAVGGSVISLSGLGVGPVHKFQGKTATATVTKLDGLIDKVEVSEPGFGYSSAPSVTINGTGQNMNNPTITLTLDAQGRVDEDNITISDRGSGFTTIFLTPSANPNVGKIATINIVEGEPKNYRVAPTLIIDAPTAQDSEGNLLSTNVQAAAVLNLDGNKNISGFTITNGGQGYVTEPQIRLGSQVHNELRAKDLTNILILYLNHKDDRSETLDETNPFELKAPFDTTARLYDQNGKLEHFGSTQIQNMGSTSINRYNVNSFVHID
jgi:hypothetical protein